MNGAARETLLTPEFLERLRALRAVLFRRRRRGEQQGLGFGQAPELEANRPYEPGDDPRYLDWKLYARFERLWVKLFVLENESQVSLLVDTSRSMAASAGKLLLATRFAAAFAYLVLAAGRALRVGAFAEGLLAAHGPYRSLHHFPAVLDFLAALPRGRGTSLARGSGEFFSLVRRRGPVLVVSDFFQEEDVRAEIERLLAAGADLHLVQVLDDAELAPRLGGSWRVSDLEGDARLDVAVGDDLLADLHARIRRYLAEVEALCRARAVPFVAVRTAERFEEAFLRHLVALAPPRGPEVGAR